MEDHEVVFCGVVRLGLVDREKATGADEVVGSSSLVSSTGRRPEPALADRALIEEGSFEMTSSDTGSRHPRWPFRRWVLIGALAIALTALQGATADACECSISSPEDGLELSKLVFAGRLKPTSMLLGRFFGRDRDPFSGMDPYVFGVDRVWKGQVGAQVELVWLGEETCGYDDFEPGVRYLVFADEHPAGQGEGLSADYCFGTRPFSHLGQASQEGRDVLAVLGRGSVPWIKIHRWDLLLALFAFGFLFWKRVRRNEDQVGSPSRVGPEG